MAEREDVDSLEPREPRGTVGLKRRTIIGAALMALVVLVSLAMAVLRPGQRDEDRGRTPSVRATADPVLDVKPARPRPRSIEGPRVVPKIPTGGSAIERRAETREEETAFSKALRSQIGMKSGGNTRSRGPQPGRAPTASEQMSKALVGMQDQLAIAMEGFAGAMAGLGGGETAEPERTDRKFEVEWGRSASGSVLRRGHVIHALLTSGINSDLPGEVRAVVSQDVIDLDSAKVAVPRGSQLRGWYEGIEIGDERLAVRWEEIQLPDGKSIHIGPGFAGMMADGQTGLAGRVDRHFVERFGEAALLSLIGAAFEIGRGDVGEGDRIGRAIAGNTRVLESAAAESLRSQAQRRPTIRIAPNTAILVLVQKEIPF